MGHFCSMVAGSKKKATGSRPTHRQGHSNNGLAHFLQEVTRIGASPQDGKKLPWNEAIVTEFDPVKVTVPQRVGHHVKRPQVPLTAIRDASGVLTPAPPMLEPSLGMTGPRNVPPARVNLDDADNTVETIAGHDPERATGRSRLNEAKGSGDPSLSREHLDGGRALPSFGGTNPMTDEQQSAPILTGEAMA